MQTSPFQPSEEGPDAVLNWEQFGLDDLLPYAIGYRRAAETLWAELASRAEFGAFADFEFPPVIFLVRHSIELCLKFVLLKARAMTRLRGGEADFDDRILKTHSLGYLWDEVMKGMARLDANSFCATAPQLPEFEDVIREFDRVDPGSYSFRYSIKKDASLSLPQHFRFSPRDTVPLLLQTAEALENLGHEVDDWLDHVFEDYVAAHGYPDDPMILRFKPKS